MVDHELNELRREFLAEADEKVREIESSLDGTPDFDRVAYLAHQLKGSGGSYGYAVISSEAAEIEHATEGAGAGGEAIRTKLRENVARLRAEIEKSQRDLENPS